MTKKRTQGFNCSDVDEILEDAEKGVRISPQAIAKATVHTLTCVACAIKMLQSTFSKKR